jgi:hypothetical protein
VIGNEAQDDRRRRPRRESFWRLRSGETGVPSSRAIDQEPDARADAPYVSKFQDTVTASRFLSFFFLLSINVVIRRFMSRVIVSFALRD